MVVYRDDARGAYRCFALRDGRLHAALYIAGEPVSVPREFVTALLGSDIAPDQRLTVLAGRPADGREEHGTMSAPVARSVRAVSVTPRVPVMPA